MAGQKPQRRIDAVLMTADPRAYIRAVDTYLQSVSAAELLRLLLAGQFSAYHRAELTEALGGGALENALRDAAQQHRLHGAVGMFLKSNPRVLLETPPELAERVADILLGAPAPASRRWNHSATVPWLIAIFASCAWLGSVIDGRMSNSPSPSSSPRYIVLTPLPQRTIAVSVTGKPGKPSTSTSTATPQPAITKPVATPVTTPYVPRITSRPRPRASVTPTASPSPQPTDTPEPAYGSDRPPWWRPPTPKPVLTPILTPLVTPAVTAPPPH